MEKNRFDTEIQPSLCSEFTFIQDVSRGTFRKSRDITILLNEQLHSNFDPVLLKRAMTPRNDNDAAYQSLSDEQKFDAIKPRSIQQPADLELYNDILNKHADEIKEDARETIERAQMVRSISQASQGNPTSNQGQQQQESISN